MNFLGPVQHCWFRFRIEGIHGPRDGSGTSVAGKGLLGPQLQPRFRKSTDTSGIASGSRLNLTDTQHHTTTDTWSPS